MSSIFLCHSNEDKHFVRKLADALRARGVRVWLDEAELLVGDPLLDRIGVAIDEMDFLAVILSHNSVGSPWVQKELKLAMTKELREHKVVVLPILLERVEIPSYLKDKVYADFTSPEKYEETFPRLLRTLGVSKSPPASQLPTSKSKAAPTTPSSYRRVPAPATAKLERFEDISIVGLDENRTRRQSPDSAMYYVYMRLSATPPTEWARIFDGERTFPRHSMWRGAEVDGDAIVVHCPLDEMARFHMRDVTQDVANSNSKYRAYLAEVARGEEAARERERTEQDRLAQLKKELGF